MQGDTLTHKNNSDEEIVFSRWNPIEGLPGQVKRITFSYSSLFGDKDISKGGVQLSLFDKMNAYGEPENNSQEYFAPIDIESVWKEKRDVPAKKTGKFKFDVVIGNPPYQEESVGEDTKAPPIYHKFMEEAYKIANRVSFITPARFLYNAGATPKAWNKKMLDDEHLKIEYFEQDSSKVFANTDIKGGVVVTYRDAEVGFGAIEKFTSFEELYGIMKKAELKTTAGSIAEIIYTQNKFDLEALYAEYPIYKTIIGSNGKDKRFRNNIFERIDLFSDEPSSINNIQILGLINNKRVYRYMPQRFVDMGHENILAYKVLVPRSNGSGAIGEVLSSPLIGSPLMGYTQTFIGIGSFETVNEAKSCLKYIKSKFARTMLGILKNHPR